MLTIKKLCVHQIKVFFVLETNFKKKNQKNEAKQAKQLLLP